MLVQFGNNWIQKIPSNYFQIGQHVVLLHIQIKSYFAKEIDRNIRLMFDDFDGISISSILAINHHTARPNYF